MNKNLRSLIEAGEGGQLVYDLTFENDANFGPSFILRLGDVYSEFWHMSCTTTLAEFCSAVVDHQLVKLLPRFEVSQDYFGFGGIFQCDPPVIDDFLEYRAMLYPPKSQRQIDGGLHVEAIAATLSVLFRKAEFHPSEPVFDAPRQLFCCVSGTTKGGGGYHLHVELAELVREFIESHPPAIVKNALNAMMLAWSATHDGVKAKRSDGFRAEFGDDQFSLSIPDGSGTNLSLPAGGANDRCWCLVPQNVDSAGAQLQLLAGLGSVFAEIREQDMQLGEI